MSSQAQEPIDQRTDAEKCRERIRRNIFELFPLFEPHWRPWPRETAEEISLRRNVIREIVAAMCGHGGIRLDDNPDDECFSAPSMQWLGLLSRISHGDGDEGDLQSLLHQLAKMVGLIRQ